MNIRYLLRAAAFGLLMSLVTNVHAELAETDSFNQFIRGMSGKHGFNETELRTLFKSVNMQQAILDAIAKPAEAKPWQQYREIFMTQARIDGGIQFMRDNRATLQAVEQRYGVPAEIIVAIIGVETKYGVHTGKYRVIDALATLGFGHPSRSEFFLKELENFLLLARQEKIDPLQPMGSYAGAMGFPQFMPSSYLAYAQDFDLDHKRDIWTNPADAIASVANYFAANHWQAGQPIAYPLSAIGEDYRKALGKGVKPDTSVGQLRQLKLDVPPQLGDKTAAKLLSYPLADREELWLGLENFYVITRYNHSPLYAMAVFQLSQAIKAGV